MLPVRPAVILILIRVLTTSKLPCQEKYSKGIKAFAEMIANHNIRFFGPFVFILFFVKIEVIVKQMISRVNEKRIAYACQKKRDLIFTQGLLSAHLTGYE